MKCKKTVSLVKRVYLRVHLNNQLPNTKFDFFIVKIGRESVLTRPEVP